MTHPYKALGPEAFWKTAVGAKNPLQIGGLWSPKFQITQDMPIVTAGSCFAQHFSRALAGRGYDWLDGEPAPPYLREGAARDYNYGIFSFRSGNIYTTRMLRQWVEQALELKEDPKEVWRTKGRFYDPLRPMIEPGGFSSKGEMFASREACYRAIRRAIEGASVFVFTLGLTESWANRSSGLEYASCPGTAAGAFQDGAHVFVNHRAREIEQDLLAALNAMRAINPDLKVLLSVSPVPLTATASGAHVLTATTYSKSVLRAVAGMVSEDHDWVDYFPSYEIITSPAFRGMFFAPNQRSVVPEGVDFVMQNFFADQVSAFGHAASAQKGPPSAVPPTAPKENEDVKCEEEMLNAFAT